MAHGEVVIFVLRLAQSVSVIPWRLSYGGAKARTEALHAEFLGAKASDHVLQTLAFRFLDVCFCTTAEETAVSWPMTRSLALSHIMTNHHA